MTVMPDTRYFSRYSGLCLILVFLIGLACAVSSCATSPAVPAGPDKLPLDAVEIYTQLAGQLKNGDTEIDFTKLRLYSTALAGFDPFSGNKEIKELESLIQKKNFVAAERKINDLFIACCADPDFHELAIGLYSQQGNKEKARRHEAIREGLLASIIGEQQGSGFTDAFTIVHYREAEAVFRALQLHPLDFSHEEKNGRHYDIILTEDAAGSRQTLYFNVDRIYTRLAMILFN